MLLLLLLWSTFCAGCPPPGVVHPCSCAEGALRCSGPAPFARLLRQGACGASLRSFEATRASNLTSLPDNLFFRLTLNTIQISESPLEELGALLGQERSLEQLSVRSCQLQQLKRLGRLQGLRFLDLSYNRLQRLPRPLPPSLRSLFLKGNRLSSVEPGELSELTSLIQLDLSENQLVAINSLPSPHLIFLTLNNNLLSWLPEGAFGGNLRRVDLSDNRLSELPRGVWASVWGDLQKLDLTGNIIECNQLEPWVRSLRPPQNLYGLEWKEPPLS